MKKEDLLKNAKPILFNTEMVKAILDGRKTQTRRVVKLPHNNFRFDCFNDEYDGFSEAFFYDNDKDDYLKIKNKFDIGDIFWVREPARVFNSSDDKYMFYEYLADNQEMEMQYPERYSQDLPKWIANCQGVPNGCIKEMARIFLKVTNVRIERLQDIKFNDIHSEGCPVPYDILSMHGKELDWWINLWNSTAKDGYKWEDNPYVFVYEFERVENEQ